MMGPFPLGTTYFGVNSCSTSTPSWLRGRSLTCPMDAMTSYFRSSSFLTVRALVGDSTTTSDLTTEHLLPDAADCFLRKRTTGQTASRGTAEPAPGLPGSRARPPRQSDRLQQRPGAL